MAKKREEADEFRLEDIVENAPFVMAYRCLLIDRRISAPELRTYLMLKAHCINSEKTFISLPKLAAELGAHLNTVRTHVHKLVENGFIREESRGHGRTTMKILTSLSKLYGLKEIMWRLGDLENITPGTDATPTENSTPTENCTPTENSRTTPTVDGRPPLQETVGISRRREVEEIEIEEEPALKPEQKNPIWVEDPSEAISRWKKRRKKLVQLESEGNFAPRPLIGVEEPEGVPENGKQQVVGGKPSSKGHSAITRQVWSEWRRFMQEHKKYANITIRQANHLEPRTLVNLKRLVREYSPEDCILMFEMAVLDWNAIQEQWPRVVKSDTPNFYSIFTLREELMAAAQTKMGVTTRSNRVSDFAHKYRTGKKLAWDS